MPLKTSQTHFFQIVRKNAFTPVNTILFLLGFVLILLGQGFDAMVSVGIVLFNTVVRNEAMHALEGRAVDTAEDSPKREGIMTASQEHVGSSLRLTHADLSRQPWLKDTYPSGRPEPQQSRWHTHWLATTLIVTTFPLLIGTIDLLFFSQVDPPLMIALLLVGGSGVLVVAGVDVLLPTIYMEIRHFSVELCPQVVIGNDFGTIRVTAGSTSNEVTIQTTTWNRRGWKASDGIWADYQQDGNTITAWVVRSNTSRAHERDSVDVDITVPSNTDLRLTTKTGDIQVTGISGQMHLGSESGSVLVQQGILRGTFWLMTNAGALHYVPGMPISNSSPLQPNGASSCTKLGQLTPASASSSALPSLRSSM